jgi:hypothetical protein
MKRRFFKAEKNSFDDNSKNEEILNDFETKEKPEEKPEEKPKEKPEEKPEEKPVEKKPRNEAGRVAFMAAIDSLNLKIDELNSTVKDQSEMIKKLVKTDEEVHEEIKP